MNLFKEKHSFRATTRSSDDDIMQECDSKLLGWSWLQTQLLFGCLFFFHAALQPNENNELSPLAADVTAKQRSARWWGNRSVFTSLLTATSAYLWSLELKKICRTFTHLSRDSAAFISRSLSSLTTALYIKRLHGESSQPIMLWITEDFQGSNKHSSW